MFLKITKTGQGPFSRIFSKYKNLRNMKNLNHIRLKTDTTLYLKRKDLLKSI